MSIEINNSILDASACDIMRYSSVLDFFRQHRMTVPRSRYGYAYWRLSDFSIGHFRGCPELRGTACATDGMLLFVRSELGDVYKGHLGNWIVDKVDKAAAPAAPRSRKYDTSCIADLF